MQGDLGSEISLALPQKEDQAVTHVGDLGNAY